MIFDGKIFKIQGASDYEDSSMFNGLIALFEYDARVNLFHFLEWSVQGPKRYVRHPYGTKYNFSRDQALCLWAGMWKTKEPHYVNKSWADGKDVFSPANNGHYARCENQQASFFQNLWLKAEIFFHAKFTPLAEPNQLIAMMMVAGPEHLKLWVKNNKQWQKSILDYWSEGAGAWRGELEFAAHMITTIKALTMTQEEIIEMNKNTVEIAQQLSDKGFNIKTLIQNKLNLNEDEQIALLEMTPKEKKAFLRDRTKSV